MSSADAVSELYCTRRTSYDTFIIVYTPDTRSHYNRDDPRCRHTFYDRLNSDGRDFFNDKLVVLESRGRIIRFSAY